MEDAPPQAHLPWWAVILGGIAIVLFIRFAVRNPFIAAMMMTNIGSGRRDGGGWGGGGSGGGGGGGFSGGGGSSGGGGASGSW
ncbi:MAG TPA: hypothetical protein VH374_21095 [Polyangia bacterium]|nr:hypothetical protein [Polyangia bacterium]